MAEILVVERRLVEASKRELAFLREYERQRSLLHQSQVQAGNDAAKLIGELRQEVQSIIRSAQRREKLGQELTFQQRALRSITGNLDEAFNALGRRIGRDMKARLEETVDLGEKLTAQAFRKSGVPMPFPRASKELLQQVASQGADLLTEASQRAKDAVAHQIRLAASGLKPASGAQAAIGNILQTSPVPRAGGVRRRIGFPYQAESVFRTQMGTAYSSAQHDATKQINKRVKGIKKRWATTGRSNVRTGHLEVERKTLENPIDLDELFTVVDYTRSGASGPMGRDGTSEFFTTRTKAGLQRVYKTKRTRRRGKIIRDQMLHPRDPKASAGNIVNCACVTIDVVPDFDETADRLIREFEEGG